MAEPVGTEDAPSDAAGDGPTSEAVGWLELFFDLVVVAAVAVLTDALRDEATWRGVGMFVLLYTAIWLTWVTVVLYANVAHDETSTRPVLVVMFLVAVMAATAPSAFPQRANVFAIAFVVARTVVLRRAWRTGRVLTGWPLLQFGGMTTPWIVSLWVPVPWKYVVWAVCLAVDLGTTVLRGGRQVQDAIDRMRQKLARRAGDPDHQRRRRRRGEAEPERPVPEFVAVEVDTIHLDDRLGVFVIIVLGEAVSGLVLAASREEWHRPFAGTAVACFSLLVGLWYLTFQFGFSAAPHARLATMPPRFGLPLHLLGTLGVLGVAAGTSEMAVHPTEPLGTSLRWIMCAGLSLHFLASVVGGLAGRSPWRWLAFAAVPATLWPLGVALLAADATPARLTWLLVVAVAWPSVFAMLEYRSGGAPTLGILARGRDDREASA